MDETRRKLLAEVESIATDVARGMGLEIVEFAFHSRGRHSQLRVDIDRPGPAGIGLADCEAFSRALERPLDTHPFFEGTYELQVSSPGLDRPIRSDADLRRNAGREVRLEFRDTNGRVMEAHGTLLGEVAPGVVRIVAPDGDLDVDRSRIVMMKQQVRPPSRKRTAP